MAKYTKTDTVQRLLDALEAGATRKAACAQAGITRETFYQWLKKLTFLTQVEEAEGKAEMRYTLVVAKAAEDDPRLALEWLKRRRPDDWGDKTAVDMNLVDQQIAELIDYFRAKIGNESQTRLKDTSFPIKNHEIPK